jgi:hypothetical protein
MLKLENVSKRTAIDRAQLVHSWVKEKIGRLDKEAHS